MNEFIGKKDRQYLDEKFQELLFEQRRTISEISEKINGSTTKIIAVIFSENRNIRQDIGYQTMILKTLEDNLSEIQFDEETGISSKIEVSVGAEIFGTGAKWVLDIDVTKVNYSDLLRAIQQAPEIPNRIKKKAKTKLERVAKII
uniref:Uncharacterized protein n=1 Tax=Candidatus Methanophagaceae archaeon ANME-1 ERB6 TaxID=2759912 RepID=A0A7G9YZF7_9EURY|nr:hypothetical protein JNHLJEBA_00001 [Methanosarcinales archaeon ANME-1 ERB6]